MNDGFDFKSAGQLKSPRAFLNIINILERSVKVKGLLLLVLGGVKFFFAVSYPPFCGELPPLLR